jgi:ferredoxin
MKAIVDHDTCIGCGMCENLCPEVFKLVEGKSTVIQKPVAEKNKKCANEAVESCPVSAISVD